MDEPLDLEAIAKACGEAMGEEVLHRGVLKLIAEAKRLREAVAQEREACANVVLEYRARAREEFAPERVLGFLDAIWAAIRARGKP